MTDTQIERKNGNGKAGAKSALAVGLAKHLGVPSFVIVAGMAFISSWAEEKEQEFKDVQKSVIELQESIQIQATEIGFLKEQKETDRAQWRAMQRLDDKMERVEITARANEIILDKVLDDLIQPIKASSKNPGILDAILGNGKKKPEIIIRRAPAKAAQSVDQYMDEQVQQHEQEQM